MGSYANFEALGKAMQSKYGKRIMILETAHSFTTGTVNGQWMGDWCDNSYNYPDWNDATNATNYTPAKRRAWLKALAEDVKRGGGIGVITWGTESLPDLLTGKAQGHGTGLYTYPLCVGLWLYVGEQLLLGLHQPEQPPRGHRLDDGHCGIII